MSECTSVHLSITYLVSGNLRSATRAMMEACYIASTRKAKSRSCRYVKGCLIGEDEFVIPDEINLRGYKPSSRRVIQVRIKRASEMFSREAGH